MASGRKSPPDIPSLDAEYKRQLAYAEEKFGQPLPVRKAAEEASASRTAYAALKRELFVDTVFVGALGLSVVAGLCDGTVIRSYGLGCAAALVYVWLLTRGVDRMSPSAPQDSLAPARLAFLGLLVVIVGRHRDDWGVQVVPTLFGVANYKIATLWKVLTGGDLDPKFNVVDE